jgi:hypothetical protein
MSQSSVIKEDHFIWLIRFEKIIGNLKKKGDIMKNLKLRMMGLCASCANWQNCALLANTTESIHQCEEFELSRDTTQPDTNLLKTLAPANKEEKKEMAPEKCLKGLCASCVSSETCILTNKETGVWFCEEYS